jgi:hypothetical protein
MMAVSVCSVEGDVMAEITARQVEGDSSLGAQGGYAPAAGEGRAPAVLWRRLDGPLAGRPRLRAVLAYAPAVGAFSMAQTGVYADVFMYQQWARHIDLFVWNLLTTPGGFGSMDMGANSTVSFLLIIVGLVALQAGLLVAAARHARSPS